MFSLGVQRSLWGLVGGAAFRVFRSHGRTHCPGRILPVSTPSRTSLPLPPHPQALHLAQAPPFWMGRDGTQNWKGLLALEVRIPVSAISHILISAGRGMANPLTVT